MLPPAAGVCVADTVHSWDIGCGEEAGEDIADKAADSVDGKNVKTFVNADEVLVLYMVVSLSPTVAEL